jgi:hypothetical protein
MSITPPEIRCRYCSSVQCAALGVRKRLERLAQFFRSPRMALAAASAFLALFLLWNVGLMFQWGSHLISARGPIAFSEMIHNQFFVVPRQLTSRLEAYLFKRKALMQQIEERDIQQQREKALGEIFCLVDSDTLSPDEAVHRSPISAAKFF